MRKKLTKADYKKDKREKNRTSKIKKAVKLATKAAHKEAIIQGSGQKLDHKFPFGNYQNLTVRQVIDEHYIYWTKVRKGNKHLFDKEVWDYDREIRTKLWELKGSLRNDRL
jgi:hypothetical protein